MGGRPAAANSEAGGPAGDLVARPGIAAAEHDVVLVIPIVRRFDRDLVLGTALGRAQTAGTQNARHLLDVSVLTSDASTQEKVGTSPQDLGLGRLHLGLKRRALGAAGRPLRHRGERAAPLAGGRGRARRGARGTRGLGSGGGLSSGLTDDDGSARSGRRKRGDGWVRIGGGCLDLVEPLAGGRHDQDERGEREGTRDGAVAEGGHVSGFEFKP